MRAFVEQCKRFWRDSVRGPRLKSYETAREELGGVPWRTLQQTERWFLAAAQGPPPVPPEALDSAVWRIASPSLVAILRAQAAWIVGGAALLALVIGVATLSSSAPALAAQATPVSVTASAPVTAPATVPAIAPSSRVLVARRAAPARPKAEPSADGMSPSVRALFASNSKSGSRKHSRIRHRGRRR